MPLMLAELITGILLVFGFATMFIFHLIGLILIILIWFSTFFIQVPQHEGLIPDFNPEKAEKLIQSNWVRTIAWSFKSILSVYILLELLENAS
jgi:regulator of protease activity HflC (stomatin/prohibitin superfamily)